MTTAERQEGKKYLRYGDVMIIARNAGVSQVIVSAWLRGKLNTSSCAIYAKSLMDQRKKEFEEKTKSSN